VILSAKEEPESRKYIFYAYLFSNLPFSKIPCYEAHLMIKTLDLLTYRHLQIFSKIVALCRFYHGVSFEDYKTFIEMRMLCNACLFDESRTNPGYFRYTLTAFGLSFYKTAELCHIDTCELNNLHGLDGFILNRKINKSPLLRLEKSRMDERVRSELAREIVKKVINFFRKNNNELNETLFKYINESKVEHDHFCLIMGKYYPEHNDTIGFVKALYSENPEIFEGWILWFIKNEHMFEHLSPKPNTDEVDFYNKHLTS